MEKKLKILVVGLGSMGKRRIRNLLKLQYDNIIGYDMSESRRSEVQKNYLITVASSITDCLKQKPNVMIISTPPDKHLKYAKIAIKNNIHFFTEVNLLSNHVEKIIQYSQGSLITASPSYTMHFHPIVKELKKLLQKKIVGKPLIVQHHSGQYLPNWHPWENYRNFFVSKRNTGGAKELMQVELLWLTHIFGDIGSVSGNVKKISKLDVDIDDVYQTLVKFRNGILCTMTVDVLSIPSFRETKIVCDRGTIVCNFNEGLIKIYKGNKANKKILKMGQVAKGYVKGTPPETLYEEELQNFFKAIKQQKNYSYTFRDELKLLRVLDSIKESSKKKKQIILDKYDA